MKPLWKHIQPWIESAAINLVPPDTLLRQVAGILAITYRADCLLWTSLETQENAGQPLVYATPRILQYLEKNENFVPEFIAKSGLSSSPAQLPFPSWHQAVRKFYARQLPDWLLVQHQQPEILYRGQGELIVPIISGGTAACPSARSLQFILQLNRRTRQFATVNGAINSESLDLEQTEPVPNLSLQELQAETIGLNQAWSLSEIDSLEIVGSQLTLAHKTLQEHQRLEKSRQQVALVGRITRLLNSCLNPDELVSRIVAELGQGLNSDRSILIDLRESSAKILAVWDHPDRLPRPLPRGTINRRQWQDVIDRFTDGGASHLEFSSLQNQGSSLQPWLRQMEAVTVLMVPLSIQEEFFGAVLLLSYQEHRTYELDELQTIQQVTDQAAIALNNAQHYQSLWFQQEALRIQNNSLRLEVVRDGLTQLLNRRSLENKLAELSAPALWKLQSPFTLMVFDIDYFKVVNDTHGHLVGDQVLCKLAQRIQSLLRQGTSAYRYGGEEFVVVLSDATLKTAIDVAERLRRAIHQQAFDTTDGPVYITASFGLTQQDPNQDKDAWSVLKRADAALYEAKRQGRNRVVDLQLKPL